MKSFSDWKAAHTEAVNLANLCNRETGIQKSKEFGRIAFSVRLLPDPENRRGDELQCEVVRPGDPL